MPVPVTGPAQSRRASSSVEPVGDELDQRRRRCAASGPSIDTAPSPTGGGLAPQPGRDLVDHHRVLVALVLGVGEDVGQQLAGAELGERPPERGDAAGPAGDVRAAGRVVRASAGRRSPAEANGLGGQAEPGVVGAQVVVEPGVGVVEEQQVLALDAEHQRLRVDARSPEHPAAEDRVQQEQREAGLGRDPGDAADRHVAAAGAVEELQVDVDRARRRGPARPGPCGPSGRSTAPARAPRRWRAGPARPAAAARSTPARRGWW